MPHAAEIERLANAIEAEMRRIGWWHQIPPNAEAFENMGAFGQNTMAFSQWLQYVLLPRVRECLENQSWPASSMVGAYAVRELDGVEEATDLVSLLCEFDAQFQ